MIFVASFRNNLDYGFMKRSLSIAKEASRKYTDKRRKPRSENLYNLRELKNPEA